MFIQYFRQGKIQCRLNRIAIFLNLPTTETCLLYTSDAADERSSVDLGGRRIIKKKKSIEQEGRRQRQKKNDDGVTSMNYG